MAEGLVWPWLLVPRWEAMNSGAESLSSWAPTKVSSETLCTSLPHLLPHGILCNARTRLSNSSKHFGDTWRKSTATKKSCDQAHGRQCRSAEGLYICAWPQSCHQAGRP